MKGHHPIQLPEFKGLILLPGFQSYVVLPRLVWYTDFGPIAEDDALGDRATHRLVVGIWTSAGHARTLADPAVPVGVQFNLREPIPGSHVYDLADYLWLDEGGPAVWAYDRRNPRGRVDRGPGSMEHRIYRHGRYSQPDHLAVIERAFGELLG